MLCVLMKILSYGSSKEKRVGKKWAGGGGGADKGFKFHTFIGRFQETSRQ